MRSFFLTLILITLSFFLMAEDATFFHCYGNKNRKLLLTVEQKTNAVTAFSYFSKETIYLAKNTKQTNDTYIIELFRPESKASGTIPAPESVIEFLKFSLPQNRKKVVITTYKQELFYYPVQFNMLVSEDTLKETLMCNGN